MIRPAQPRAAQKAAGPDDGDRLLPLRDGGPGPDPRRADLFAGSWQLLSELGAVPRVLVWEAEDYSVHPAVIGRRVDVHADLQRIRTFCDGSLVADHQRVWAKHQTLSLDEHVAAAKALRTSRVGLLHPAPVHEVQTRALSDYDTALGLAEPAVAGPAAEGGVA